MQERGSRDLDDTSIPLNLILVVGRRKEGYSHRRVHARAGQNHSRDGQNQRRVHLDCLIYGMRASVNNVDNHDAHGFRGSITDGNITPPTPPVTSTTHQYQPEKAPPLEYQI